MNSNFEAEFEWDEAKDLVNQFKHNLSFDLAKNAFKDPRRLILKDSNHSNKELRFYCIGKVEKDIVTVRFTYRNNVIRIIGAGYWRKGKKIYEEKVKIHS